MIYKEIWDMIEKYDKITIFRHIRPDGDAYGAQIGLKHLILSNLENKEVKCLGKRSNMFEKLFDKVDEDVSDEFIKSSLAIILDTANLSRIDDERHKLAKKTIKIDHHVLIEHFGDIELVDDNCIATSELITELAYVNDLYLPLEAAEPLFLGIVTDSGRFLYQNVNYDTFNYAAYLLKAGIDMNRLYTVLYNQKENELRFKGYCQLNYQTTANGVAYMMIKPSLQNEFKITPSFAASLVNVLANIEDVEIHVHFVEDLDGRIRIEFRSKEIPVNLVASKYGGGGHRLASGAIVDSWDIAKIILQELDELCLRGNENV